MSTSQRALCGCVLLPLMLISSCCGKMYYNAWRYELPGQVLASTSVPTQKLTAPMQVAEALDAYVQPRFEILRDMNFGALRIVYREHAGLVQLKVESPEERRQIANVNAARRDYAISLLRCVPVPGREGYAQDPKLHMLYFNQQSIENAGYFYHPTPISFDRMNGFDQDAIEKKAIKALPALMKGREQRAHDGEWNVLMRPVRAFKPECLSCHTTAKPGATLGVMVYAVRDTRRDEVAKNSSK